MEGKYVERYEELKNESILCTDHISIWMKGTLASLKKKWREDIFYPFKLLPF
jgi:hypothetical protein